jgi:hypothetical protein
MDVLLLRSAVARLSVPPTAQRIAATVAAVFYIAAGTLRFIKAAPYNAALRSVARGDGADQRRS